MPVKRSAKPVDASDSDPVLLPVPENHPPCDHGKPHVVREYKNEDGNLLFYQVRYLKYDRNGNIIIGAKGTPEKLDRYRVLRKTISGTMYWDFEWGGIPKPRPLYRAQYLPLNPGQAVVICEGEKAAEAAAELFPNHVSVAWMGGAPSAKYADWKVLAGRHVLVFRDHDEAGMRAAKDVVNGVINCAASVSVINLESLSRHVGHALKKGYDADDLRTVDGWDSEAMSRFLADGQALLPGVDFAGVDEGAGHSALIEAIERYLNSEGITVNAAEQWCDGESYRPMPRANVMTIGTAFCYMHRHHARVSTGMVTETLSVIGARAATTRRNQLILKLTDNPTDPMGMRELVRFVHACCGRDDVTVLHGLRHWIWLVKRTLVGKPRAWDLMPVFYGKQRSGKSTAVARLCGPLEELCTSVQSNTLVDERSAPILGRFYAGIWDELEGIGRAETEAIKNAITCTTKMHRVLGSHESGTVVRVMNFIGTSNRPIGQVMRDTTGLGRFMQVDCLDHIEWEVINAIDYDLLWRCVSEDDEPPVKTVAEDLAAEQELARHRDNISLWIEQETWERLVWDPVPGGGTMTICEYNSEVGETAEEIRSRYIHWCKRQGEPPVSGNIFWQRLSDEGFTQWKPRVAGGPRLTRYRKPGPKQETL